MQVHITGFAGIVASLLCHCCPAIRGNGWVGRLLCPAVCSTAQRNGRRRLCISLPSAVCGAGPSGCVLALHSPFQRYCESGGCVLAPCLSRRRKPLATIGLMIAPFVGRVSLVWLQVAGALGVANPLCTARLLPVGTRRSAGAPLWGASYIRWGVYNLVQRPLKFALIRRCFGVMTPLPRNALLGARRGCSLGNSPDG